MRVVKAALVAPVLSASTLLAGCPDERPGAAAAAAPLEDCRFVLRTPEAPAAVAWRDGRPVEAQAGCPSPRCLDARGPFVAVLQHDGAVRVTGGGHDEVLARAPSLFASAFLPGVALGKDVAIVETAEGLVVLREHGARRVAQPPLLGQDEKLAGPFVLEDGLAAWVYPLKPHWAPPRRAIWIVPPAVDVLAELPPGSFPIAKRGRLRGLLVDEGGAWSIRDLATKARIPLPEGTIPHWAGIGDETDTAVVGTREGIVVLAPGAPPRSIPHGRGRAVLPSARAQLVVDQERGVLRVVDGVEEPLRPRTPGADLAGGALPAGAAIERLEAGGDSEQLAMLVVERVRLPSCRTEDRVHLVDGATGTVTTLAKGDRVRMHPRVSREGPAWVEAEAVYRTVSIGGGAASGDEGG